MFASTLYSFLISAHQSRKVAVLSAIPLPRIATNRPLGSSLLNACSTCLFANWVAFFCPILPAVAEKGGFIRTTVGLISSGKILSICSAFSVNTLSKSNSLSSFALLSDNSLTTTFALAFFAKTASPPTPALGSKTVSPGLMFAAQAATNAILGGVENCWNASCSSVRFVCVGIIARISSSIISSVSAARPRLSMPGLNPRSSI